MQAICLLECAAKDAVNRRNGRSVRASMTTFADGRTLAGVDVGHAWLL